METYLTIEELSGHLKLAEQTIRRWVLNREIPFHKIRKVIRFRLSEVEGWIDNGGINQSTGCGRDNEGDLFNGEGSGKTAAFGENEQEGETAETGGAKKCARTGEGVDETNVTRRAPEKCFTVSNDEGGGV